MTKAGFAALAECGEPVPGLSSTIRSSRRRWIFTTLPMWFPPPTWSLPTANQIAIWTTAAAWIRVADPRHATMLAAGDGHRDRCWNGTAPPGSWITTPSGGTGGVSTFAGLSGRFTWAQGPAVSAVDNGKIRGCYRRHPSVV